MCELGSEVKFKHITTDFVFSSYVETL